MLEKTQMDSNFSMLKQQTSILFEETGQSANEKLSSEL